MSLERYRSKRDFGRTPEPSGSAAGSIALGDLGGRFVVQRHRARRLHYDLRLEVGGVLVSWAVPKGPTLDSAVKRAAFKVEDHPLDYYDFEGTIPKGEYGAGDVIVWDWGTYEPEATDDPARALADGELKFALNGEKLHGRFTIVRTGGRAAGGGGVAPDEDAWLLIKKRDQFAVAGWDPEEHLESVKTGRTNDEVAAGKAAGRAAPGPGTAPSAAGEQGVSAPMPAFIEPMTATLADRPFSNADWLFELKWDGYRVQTHVRDGRMAMYTRRGLDAADYFPELAGPPTWLKAREAILDGEVVALDESGRPDFGLLQRRKGGQVSRGGTLVYEVFDLLYVDGRSLVDLPLLTRKGILRSILVDTPAVQYASHIDADGEAFYRVVAERGLEGIMAKLKRSRYESGRRSPAWLKLKIRSEQEVVIGGWTPREGADNDLGALIVGVSGREDGLLVPAGKVGTGFDGRERRRLLDALERLARSTPPFRPIPKEKGARWVEPSLVARVEFAEWTADGNMRAPSYKGLEIDGDPRNAVRERPAPASELREAAEEREAPPNGAPDFARLDALPGKGGLWTVEGRELKLSNLDKVLWPGDGVPKRELIRYYTRIAPVLLPYLGGRALTLHRYPDGIERTGFWQKQVPGHAPQWIECWPWVSKGGSRGGESTEYMVATERAALTWLANEAAIDVHPSTFLIAAPTTPTWALIDIDPGKDTTWEDVLVLARLYRTALDHLAVKGFPKVTGQRGIQVWIPIEPRYTFGETAAWVESLSRTVAQAVPGLVSWVWEKSGRDGLARLDYTQNAWNKTLVAPYSVRPAPGAPVSAPIAWEELDDPDLRPNRWNIVSIFDRLEERGDLFAPALGLAQALPRL